MEDKIKVLWIPEFAPYDSVPHAGGKICNFYLKRLHATSKYNLKVLSFCSPKNISKIDLDEYGINNDLYCYWDLNNWQKAFWHLVNMFSKNNPFDKYANYIDCYNRWGHSCILKKNLKEGFYPDVIILQWTQTVLFAPIIKKIYPCAKIIAIEEDVAFLSYERRMNASHGISKILWKHKYNKLRKIELEALTVSDLVINNNRKDEVLLKDANCGLNTWVWCPYFQSMIDVKRKEINKDILFYGAMNREENWSSAIWFIKNVFYRIEDKSVRFIIVGNHPNNKLKEYEDDRVKVLGYVEDVKPLFKHSLCLVAPLVLGAGVKIKVLEGLSSGIPVLTNKIGIEGIPAKNKNDYFYCQEPEEYLKVINELLQNPEVSDTIERNAKEFILNNYDFYADSKEFAERVIPSLIEK